jgi:hypothetical protein
MDLLRRGHLLGSTLSCPGLAAFHSNNPKRCGRSEGLETRADAIAQKRLSSVAHVGHLHPKIRAAESLRCLTVPANRAVRHSEIRRSPNSGRHAAVDPTLKDLDSLGRPRAVTRHRPILHAFQNIGSVSANVVEGPKIKCSFHGLLVTLPEEWLDVRCEAQAVVVRRRIHPAQFSPVGPPSSSR